MTLLRSALFSSVTSIAILMSAAAPAQTVSGLYIAGGAGINMWHDQSSGGVRVHDQDVAAMVLGSIGWGFGNGWRVELEGSYRPSQIDKISYYGAAAGDSGTIRNFAGMANAFFDFDLSSFGLRPVDFMPYVGGGIGAGWYNINGARFNVGGSSYRAQGTDTQFAYQGIAGVAFGLGGIVPGLALTAEYRFYGTLDQKIGVERTAGPAIAGVPSSLTLANTNQSVLLGLRYSFGATPPPAPEAPVAPAPAPARTYLVFFDWDRADLSDRARQIIAEAAENSTKVQSTRIEVAGHADRSGTPQYNQRLSQRRADNVAAELVRRGVPREAISVTAYGETRPLVPTADGVREPQNRRVEIVLR